MRSKTVNRLKTLGACLILFALIYQSCIASPADSGSAAANAQKNSFVRNAPLPSWALPIAPIPETKRTDPVVLRLSEYQIQLGTETAMLISKALQVNERNALAQIGQYSIVYYPIFQKLKLHKVALIRAGRVIDKMDSVNIRQLQRETSMEMGMYGGATTVELLLDDVRIGDTLWVTYSVSGENPVFDKKWHSEFSWEYDHPIELHRITVTYPKSRNLFWGQIGDFKKEIVASRVEELNGQHRVQFEERNIAAIDFEPATPSEFMPVRVVEFSEFANWQGVARWADGLFPKVKASPLLSGLVHQFSEEATPERKAAAALHWVQNEVRYFSVSIGENSHRPQPPDAVIKKRYGDCKDKSYLLVNILNQLGIKAYPVLIASHAPKIPSKVLPSPEWFDHVIVRIDINDHHYFVDPTLTGQVSPLENLPAAMPGAAGLLVDSATTDLIALPERADVGPNYEHAEKITVARLDGDAALDMDDTYSGFYSDYARNHFVNLSETELIKELLSYYEKQYPGVSISGNPALRDDGEKNQFHVHAYFNLPTPVRHENQRYQIDFDSQILKGAMRIPDKLVRSFPFQINSGRHFSRYRLTIEWPEDVHLTYPPSREIMDNPYFSVSDDTTMHDRETAYSMDFRVKDDVVPAEEMATMHAQTKLLDKYVNNFFKIPENMVSKVGSWAQPFRSLNASRAVNPVVDQDVSVAKDAPGAAQKLSQEQTEKGHMYYFGKGVPVDYPKAVDWYSRAAAGGNAVAQFNLGTMYENGQGVPKDFVRAAVMYQKAAAQGYANAQANLGYMFEYGNGVPPDLAMAAEWYRKAAEQGHVQAMSSLGHQYHYGIGVAVDYVKAREWYLKAANEGNAAAQNNLGTMYSDGSGVPQDFAQALEWCRKSAEQGNAVAQSNLGAKYERGEGVSVDMAKAMEWYEKSALQGYAKAQNSLGNMYKYGRGTKKNDELARFWYRKAADQGLAFAQSNLGEMDRLSSKSPYDFHDAVDLLQKAAAQSDTSAMISLGIMYHLGQSFTKDYVVAYALYDSAYAIDMANGKTALANRDKVARLMFRSDIEAAKTLSADMRKSGNLLSAIETSVHSREPTNLNALYAANEAKMSELIAQDTAQKIQINKDADVNDQDAASGTANRPVIRESDLLQLWERTSLEGLDRSAFNKSEQLSMLARITFNMLRSNSGQCHDPFEFVSSVDSRQINPGANSGNRSELWTLLGCKLVKKFVIVDLGKQVIYTPYEFAN